MRAAVLPVMEAPVRTDSGVRQLFANGGWLLLAYVLPRVFTFGAVIVAARALGTREFGAYGTAAAFAVILSILGTLGMSPLLVREIARTPLRAPQLLRAAHLVKAVTSCVMLATLAFVATRVMHYPYAVVDAALLLGVGYAVGAFSENYGAYFQAREQMHVWTQANATFGLISGVAGLLLVVVTRSVVWFSAAFAIGQVACLAWLIMRSPASGQGVRVNWPDITNLLRSLAPFAAAFVALTIYYKVDVLVLARLRPPAEVGEYSAAYKFIDILQALVIVASSAVYPRLARTAARSTSEGKWTGAVVTELMLLATVPAAVLLWLMRAPFIHFMYGSEYHGSTVALAFLAPAMPALAINILAGYLFGAAARMERVAICYALCAILKISLDWILIPIYGAAGAATAMLIAEWLLAAVLLASLRRTMGIAIGVPAMVGVASALTLCGAVLTIPDRSGGILRAVLFVAGASMCYWKLGVVRAMKAAR